MVNPEAPNLAGELGAVVLAGGRGLRMGGVDKGLQIFRGETLVAHAIARLRAQRGLVPQSIVVNANRNAPAYAALGVPVVADDLADFQGPLAGMLAALQQCPSAYLLSVPCDSPLFPLDLAVRLMQALQASGAALAMAHAPEAVGPGRWALRRQPVFCLMRRDVAPGLQAFLASGGRKIDQWTAAQGEVLVPFDAPGDDPQAFANANTLEELQRLESDLARGQGSA